MRQRIARFSIPIAAAALAFFSSCERAVGSREASVDQPTATELRVTGGGRIDPTLVDKVTFGFTVDGTSGPPYQGQLQVVFHLMLDKAHSVTIDQFELVGTCAHFRGTVRTPDGHNNHRFRAVACDNGEPGSSPGTGPDKFGICIDDHRSTDPLARDPVTGKCTRDPDPTPLTGGNIQLH